VKSWVLTVNTQSFLIYFITC